MARLPLPSVDEMTSEQREVHDEIVSGVRGRLVGPLRAVIHSPDLARRWSRLGEYLRFSTCLPKKLNELAIIVTGRRCNSQLEFLIHAEAAEAAGLNPSCIEAIRLGEEPTFADDAEAEVYEFARLLQETEAGPYGPVHAAVMARWGARGVVELTGVIGYYTMVSMMLNAHEIPIPTDAQLPLCLPSSGGLTTLPKCRLAKAKGAHVMTGSAPRTRRIGRCLTRLRLPRPRLWSFRRLPDHPHAMHYEPAARAVGTITPQIYSSNDPRKDTGMAEYDASKWTWPISSRRFGWPAPR